MEFVVVAVLWLPLSLFVINGGVDGVAGFLYRVVSSCARVKIELSVNK